MAGPAGSTFAESFEVVNTLLDDPSPNAPNPRVVLEHYKTEAQLLLNQAQNSAISWNVRSFTLTTSADQDDYEIAEPGFGKDVLIHTVDSLDPYHVERAIKRVSLQSRPAVYEGVRKAAASPTSHSAELIVTYWEDGIPHFQFRPVPAGAASYKVWYEVALIADGSIALGTTPILPVAHPYLHLRVAKACLPYAQWPHLAPEAMAAKRRDLLVTFNASIAEQREAFLKYIATDRQHGVIRRRGFDDAEYEYPSLNPYTW